MYKGFKLGIVIPAYNEEILIGETLADLPEFADRVYVIDDGSTDNTSETVKRYVNDKVCLITKKVNQGPGAALVTGYKEALKENMDIVVKMDGDKQMNSEYLPDLLEPIITNKADYSKGNRLSRFSDKHGMSNWRFLGNWILTVLTKIASGYWSINDPQNGYTAINRKALAHIDLDDVYGYYGYLNDILVKLKVANCAVVDIPMRASYGKEKSKIRYSKYIPKVSILLLNRFFWRLKVQYLKIY